VHGKKNILHEKLYNRRDWLLLQQKQLVEFLDCAILVQRYEVHADQLSETLADRRLLVLRSERHKTISTSHTSFNS